MLKAIGEGERLRRRVALLLGAFDGMHLGHMTLLRAAAETGAPVAVLTIAGGKAGGDLFTREERRTVFERVGVRYALEYAYSEALWQTSAERFLEALFARVHPHAVFCGEDFRFGRGAQGTPALLAACAPCPVFPLPLARADGEKISSSHIKQRIADADMAGANALLAVPYFLQGRVEHGRAVGRTLGFPTANLSLPPEKALPREGVYFGHAETPRGSFPAIVNIGARPTFGVAERKAEVYLHGFRGDLYGRQIRIFPERFLRPVIAFSSAHELEEQLRRDREVFQT